jgi:hypothetical protein
VRCIGPDTAIEHVVPGKQPEETIWLPLAALDDLEAKSDEIVELTAIAGDKATAAWQGQLIEYESKPPDDADSFPAAPKELAENPPALLQAYTAASETTDPNSARYALANVRLRGDDGSLASTDGKQLLRQEGFAFPWKGDVLVAHSKVLGSRELPHDLSVSVGKSDNWVTFQAGDWTVHLRIDTAGRFPNVETIVPATDKASGSCHFTASDVKFLLDELPKLPVDDDGTNCVTLDLNGQVVVRAKRADDAKPTEVVLSASSFSGKPRRVNVNCKQFARAIKLGLSDLYDYDNNQPMLWRDEFRSYVTAAVPSDSCIEPAADAIRIESPNLSETVAKPKTRKKTKPVKAPDTNASGSAQPQPQIETEAAKPRVRKPRADKQEISLIDQAIDLRSTLYSLTQQANTLVTSLKQQRRANKAVQQTLDQIRSLKSLVA